MKRSTSYVVNEHFATFQGEGFAMGLPAYFVRLHGCDQSCHFCDSAGTWHPGFKSTHPRYSAKEVADLVAEGVDREFGKHFLIPPFVVLTGGEPTLYNLEPLIDALHDGGFGVHLETAGHHPLPQNVDFVTVSPKPFAKPPLPESVFRANEFKLIVEGKQSLHDSLKAIDHQRQGLSPIWLHPEWSKREDPEVLNLIIETVKNPPMPGIFRAGWQVHKLYRVDQLDPNADKRRIPLGGLEKNGY